MNRCSYSMICLMCDLRTVQEKFDAAIWNALCQPSGKRG